MNYCLPQNFLLHDCDTALICAGLKGQMGVCLSKQQVDINVKNTVSSIFEKWSISFRKTTQNFLVEDIYSKMSGQ